MFQAVTQLDGALATDPLPVRGAACHTQNKCLHMQS